ncbi:uncharacterized protein [Tenebrio molitor]|uniref:uncharacterized protein n=1 Tax=Tenebrio molitor TaxID=7067 RepID=UPI0036248DA6
MCYVVLRQLLVFVFILSVRGIGIPLHKIVDLRCFKCGIPQPRSVVVAQEIEIVQETAPYMAILHRCDAGSGCCSKGFICKTGPFRLPRRLNGEDYSDFLENNLPELLQDVDLNLRRQIWFQHDGPLHAIQG